MTKRFGFTLAEVLITLGIIGVVAAMTMPTLMNSTQGAQYKAAYKKALSSISQGVTLNVALDGVNFAEAAAGTAGSIDKTASGADTVASILAARMNIVNHKSSLGYTIPEAKGVKSSDTENTVLFFNDGVVFSYKAADATSCTKDPNMGTEKLCKGFIDVNGQKGPNKVVACASATGTCEVKNPTDVYPVVFYDQTILPATEAARAVLYGK